MTNTNKLELDSINTIQKFIVCFLSAYLLGVFIFGANESYVHMVNLLFIPLAIVQALYLTRKKCLLSTWSFGLIIFLMVLILGVFYSYNSKYALSLTMTFLILNIFSILTINTIDNINVFVLLIKSFTFSGILFNLYILNFYGLVTILEYIKFGKRLGYEISQPNTLGHYIAFSFTLNFYNFLYSKEKKSRVFFLVMSVISATIAVSTLSRKAILLIVFSLISIWFYKNKKQYFKIIIILLLIVYFYNFVSNISFSSDFIDRIRSMISVLISSGSNSNSSDLARKTLILDGVKYFKNNFLIGLGTGSFRFLSISSSGHAVASHNNFIEIGTNHGILGILAYYIPLIFSSFKLYKLKKKTEDPIANLLFILTFSDIFVSGITLITYVNKLSLIIYSLGVSYLIIKNKER